jgi:hypothetical protein
MKRIQHRALARNKFLSDNFINEKYEFKNTSSDFIDFA